MSYDAVEKSQAGGSPVEAYLFVIGGESFRYTSQTASVTLAGNVYEPLEIERTNPKQNNERSGVQLTITMPADNSIPRKFLQIAPVARLSCAIFRAHRTDGGTPEVITFWKGYITNVRFKDQIAELVGEPIQAFFSREMPRRTFQSLCNHVLFDSGCKLAKSGFSDNVTVSSVNGDTLVLNSLSAARPADTTFYRGGYVERANGDKRLILVYTFATNTVRLLLPFDGIQVGETVTARAGCGRDLTTCLNKFSNVINFGGFPYVPGKNPFEVGFGKT